MSLPAEKEQKNRPVWSIWAWTCFSCFVLLHWLINDSIGYRSLLTVGESGYGLGCWTWSGVVERQAGCFELPSVFGSFDNQFHFSNQTSYWSIFSSIYKYYKQISYKKYASFRRRKKYIYYYYYYCGGPKLAELNFNHIQLIYRDGMPTNLGYPFFLTN